MLLSADELGALYLEEVDITSYAPHLRWITCLSPANWSIGLKNEMYLEYQICVFIVSRQLDL